MLGSGADEGMKYRQSVYNSALVRLSVFEDPVVARITARSDFRMRDLFRLSPLLRPVSLYLTTPASEDDRLRPATSLFLSLLIGAILREQPALDGEPRCLLVIDEFASLRMEILQTAITKIVGCGATMPRERFQGELARLNPAWLALDATDAPDGDADLEQDFSSFVVPACEVCGGVLKPDVVFFGENVPRDTVASAQSHLEQADALLVVGSSLMVYSGFRFVRMAEQRGLPIAAVNLGRTRADELLTLKVEDQCEAALAFLL